MGRGSFTHLHVHTEYSMLDGAARIGETVGAAVADGQPAIGITDHGNMYGILDFYKECRKQGIKPVLGTEAYMAHDHRSERPTRRGRIDDSGGDTEGGRKLYYHLTLLAENEVGYRNLIQLASLAFLEGYYYKPRIDWELLERYHDGIIATTGCLGGHVLQALMHGDEQGAFQKAGRLQVIFGKDNLFVELQDHGLQAQRVLARGRVVAGPHVGGGLGAQVALLGLEPAYLAHQALRQAGVRGQALVEVADLLAQVLLLQFEQGLRVATLDAGYEQRQETLEQVGDASEHGVPPRAPGALRRGSRENKASGPQCKGTGGMAGAAVGLPL